MINIKRKAEVEEMINIKEGKQAGPTNPKYEDLKLQIKSIIEKKKKIERKKYSHKIDTIAQEKPAV